MSVTCVFGAQWGDEGKGKVVDYLAADADIVVRYQGGSNAGHTIKIGDDQFAIRLTPSGVLQGATGVIARSTRPPRVRSMARQSLSLDAPKTNIVRPPRGPRRIVRSRARAETGLWAESTITRGRRRTVSIRPGSLAFPNARRTTGDRASKPAASTSAIAVAALAAW